MKILYSFAEPHSVPNLYDSSVEHTKEDIFKKIGFCLYNENQWSPIWTKINWFSVLLDPVDFHCIDSIVETFFKISSFGFFGTVFW